MEIEVAVSQTRDTQSPLKLSETVVRADMLKTVLLSPHIIYGRWRTPRQARKSLSRMPVAQPCITARL
jgi:hypothetical protein